MKACNFLKPSCLPKMAICNIKSALLLHLFVIIILLSLKVPLVRALSFNFSSFSTANTNITYERAYPEDQVIILAAGNGMFGRATYYKPMRLWDKATGNLTDFTTHFTFVIDSNNRSRYGDGLTFFLAPEGSKIPVNATRGGSFGLANDDERLNSTSNTFVAVEFDIYKNHYDLEDSEHVGIDINSLQSELVTFGFSGATGNSTARHTINSWDFSSKLEVDENSTSPVSESSRKSKTGLALGMGIGGGILVAGLVLVWLAGICRKRNAYSEYIDDEFENGTGPKKFAYKELARATNNFNEGQKLGKGGFGEVYRGLLRHTNSYIAVKRVSKDSKQGIKEYATEVKIISRLRHRNLVQLLGWCHEKKDLLLVYEFLPNGSLDSHLFKETCLLTWEMRYKIAYDLALGLQYLHEEGEQCVLHRDIKSSNIMLDSNFNTKLGDFGLARLVDHEKGSEITGFAGTVGYMAPECRSTESKASKESDVFSFGVVALEIACGRRSVEHNFEEDQVSLVPWVWESYGNERLLDVVDRKLCMNFDVQQMECLIIVGLWCAHPDRDLRPTIKQVIQVLNFELSLPGLPPKIPTLKDDILAAPAIGSYCEPSYCVTLPR